MTDDNFVISAYTRAMALADGVLVEAGRYAPPPWLGRSVAFTRAAWEDVIVREGRVDLHSPAGRVWDVLCWLLADVVTHSARRAECVFKVSRPSDPSGRGFMMLKAVTGPDDDGNPCLTIMLPHED